jgi:hypothetical protein
MDSVTEVATAFSVIEIPPLPHITAATTEHLVCHLLLNSCKELNPHYCSEIRVTSPHFTGEETGAQTS